MDTVLMDNLKILAEIVFYIALGGGVIKIGQLLIRRTEGYHDKEYSRGLGIKQVDLMEKKVFISYLRAVFLNLGYKVHANYRYEVDGLGVDIILHKNNEKILVKTKISDEKVDVDSIQEIYTAVPYYEADKAYVITNNKYTRKAKALAESINVELIDRNKLKNFINESKIEVT